MALPCASKRPPGDAHAMIQGHNPEYQELDGFLKDQEFM